MYLMEEHKQSLKGVSVVKSNKRKEAVENHDRPDRGKEAETEREISF